MKRIDWIYLVAVLLLVGMGLVSLWTHTPPTNLKNESITQNHFVKQSVFLLIALVLLAVVMIPSYVVSRKIAYLPYVLLLATLIALPFMVKATNGARGWIPVGPLKLQPAEIMKIGVVLALGRWLALARDLTTWRSLIMPFAIAGVPAAIIFAQPDLGNAMLFFPVCMVMLFIGGARTKHLLIVLAVVIAIVPFAYRFGMKEYQRARFTSFIWPERVPKDLSRQQQESIKACASGGFAGRGPGESGQSIPFYVPERPTAFGYSIIAEECGWAGSTFVLILFGLLFWRGAAIARRTGDPYGRLLVVGLTVFLAAQVFINIGMNIGVAPITGLTLPFVSYGGSSLLTCFLTAGIVLNVGARWVPTFSSRDLDRGHREIREFVPQAEKWLVH